MEDVYIAVAALGSALVLVFGATALLGVLLTAKTFRSLKLLGDKLGLSAKRGFLFLLPKITGTYRGFPVVLKRILASKGTPQMYYFSVRFAEPFPKSFSIMKKNPLIEPEQGAGNSIEERMRIRTEDDYYIQKISRNESTLQEILLIDGDENTRFFSLTSKKCFWAIFERGQSMEYINSCLDRLIVICEKVESLIR